MGESRILICTLLQSILLRWDTMNMAVEQCLEVACLTCPRQTRLPVYDANINRLPSLPPSRLTPSFWPGINHGQPKHCLIKDNHER
jgi:hypothetical protein